MFSSVLRFQRLILAFALGGIITTSATAEGWDATVEPAAPVAAWREVSVGGMATLNGWAAYSGSTFAPFGDLASDGFRFRMSSGYGRYHYTTALPAQGDCRYGNGRSTQIQGRTTFADILAGYQTSMGSLTIKAFAGAASDAQELSVLDICNASQGRAYGAKAVIETWLNITPRAWAALDGSWTGAHASYTGKLRVGYRIIDNLSLGLEESVAGNVAGRQLNSGIFARYEWSWGEASVSGGVSSETADFRDIGRERMWAAVNVAVKY